MYLIHLDGGLPSHFIVIKAVGYVRSIAGGVVRHGLDAVVFIGVGVLAGLAIRSRLHLRHALGSVVAVVHRLPVRIGDAGQRSIGSIDILSGNAAACILRGSLVVAIGGIGRFGLDERRVAGLLADGGQRIAIGIVREHVALAHGRDAFLQQVLLMLRGRRAVAHGVLRRVRSAGLAVRLDVIRVVVLDIRLLRGQIGHADEVLVRVVGKALAELLAVDKDVREIGPHDVARVLNADLQLRIGGRCDDRPFRVLPADALHIELVVLETAPVAAGVLETAENTRFEAVASAGHGGILHPAAEDKHISFIALHRNRLAVGRGARKAEATDAHGLAGQTGGHFRFAGRNDTVERAGRNSRGGRPAGGEGLTALGVGHGEVAVDHEIDVVCDGAGFHLRTGEPRAAGGRGADQFEGHAARGEIRRHIQSIPSANRHRR